MYYIACTLIAARLNVLHTSFSTSFSRDALVGRVVVGLPPSLRVGWEDEARPSLYLLPRCRRTYRPRLLPSCRSVAEQGLETPCLWLARRLFDLLQDCLEGDLRRSALCYAIVGRVSQGLFVRGLFLLQSGYLAAQFCIPCLDLFDRCCSILCYVACVLTSFALRGCVQVGVCRTKGGKVTVGGCKYPRFRLRLAGTPFQNDYSII
jgi:hypothetical protein